MRGGIGGPTNCTEKQRVLPDGPGRGGGWRWTTHLNASRGQNSASVALWIPFGPAAHWNRGHWIPHPVVSDWPRSERCAVQYTPHHPPQPSRARQACYQPFYGSVRGARGLLVLLTMEDMPWCGLCWLLSGLMNWRTYPMCVLPTQRVYRYAALPKGIQWAWSQPVGFHCALVQLAIHLSKGMSNKYMETHRSND